MGFELIPFASGLIRKQSADEIAKCNDFTAQYGLTLTQAQAMELVETRFHALRDTGRIEFGGGVINKIIGEFCDSPYISMHNYSQTMHDLLEIFYYYKNETMDLISDEDLIKYMKNAYDNACQGSLELLSGRELYHLAKDLRFGTAGGFREEGFLDEEEEADE